MRLTRTLRDVHEPLSDRIARASMLVAAAGTPLIVVRPADNIFQGPKTLLLVACAAVAVGAVLLATLRRGRLELPASRALPAAGVLAGALVVTTVTSSLPLVSLVGTYGRPSGLLRELSLVALLVVTATVIDARTARRLVGVTLVAGVLGGAYAIVQQLGYDPYGWATDAAVFPFSTFGNRNFLAAFVGICVPLTLWAVTTVRSTLVAMLAASSIGVLLLATWWSKSVQGGVVAAAGLLVYAVAWTLTRGGRWRRVGPRILAAVAAAGMFALLAGLLALGPLAVLAERRSFAARRGHWQTALSIAQDSPIIGSGLDTYAAHYTAHRPVEMIARFGGSLVADDPHNLLLSRVAEGGAVLLLAWVALAVVIGAILVGAVRRTAAAGDRQAALLLGALGAGWVGYHVQSLVSIDVPPLAVVHALFAGAIVGLGAGGVRRSWRLPTALLAQPGRAVAVGAVTISVVALLGVLGVALWADVEARNADRPISIARSLDHAEQAVRLAPWQAEYRDRYARLLADAGRDRDSERVWRELVDMHPRWRPAHTRLARYARDRGDTDRALAYYRITLALDPNWPVVTREAATFHLRRGAPEPALQLMERAVEIAPEQSRSWTLLGWARAELGQEEAARRALERALEEGDDDDWATRRAQLLLAQLDRDLQGSADGSQEDDRGPGTTLSST